MPPAIASLPPEALRDVLLKDGWEVSLETEWNWEFCRNGHELILPRMGHHVSLEVMQYFMMESGLTLGRLWELLEEAGHSYYVQ